MPKWRRATWALVIWTVSISLWTASYSVGMGDCADETGWALTVCEAGRAIGTGMGIPFIIIVASVGFVLLGLVWLVSRPLEHPDQSS